MEFSILEITGNKKRKKFLSAVETLFSILSGKAIFSLGNNKPIYNYILDIDDNDNLKFKKQTKELYRWGFLADLSNVIVWAGFIIMLGYGGYKYSFEFRSMNSKDVASALVLLTYSMIAVNYYKNVFGSLDTSILKGGGKLTNFWLRLCSLYWPIPILFAFYKGEHWWAYVAALGTFIVAINNFLNYRLARIAIKRISPFELPQIINDRLEDFKFWWIFMLFYALGMLSFGFLLDNGVLVDELAFITITILVNIKMYLINCQDQAFNTTKALKFLYTRYDRHLRMKSNSSS